MERSGKGKENAREGEEREGMGMEGGRETGKK